MLSLLTRWLDDYVPMRRDVEHVQRLVASAVCGFAAVASQPMRNVDRRFREQEAEYRSKGQRRRLRKREVREVRGKSYVSHRLWRSAWQRWNQPDLPEFLLAGISG